jgi:hypothetical protein
MDLVEEVALGYGIQNFEPTISPSQTLGQTNPISFQLKISKSNNDWTRIS